MFKLHWKKHDIEKRFAVYVPDIPVTLKQGQGHQTWYESVVNNWILTLCQMVNCKGSTQDRSAGTKHSYKYTKFE